MFNVKRPSEAPECTKKTGYNTDKIVSNLKDIFHGKCYLCEQDDLIDPEIEHLIPHEGDETLKYKWTNLYLSCGRCNSIKGSTHKNILDCCNDSMTLWNTFKCLLPSTPNGNIIVQATTNEEDESIKNTATLLSKCYNESNTPLRGITRSVLFEKIFDHYCDIISYRRTILSKKSTTPEISYATLRIQSMLKISFPFSVFWKWYLLSDDKLLAKIGHLLNTPSESAESAQH